MTSKYRVYEKVGLIVGGILFIVSKYLLLFGAVESILINQNSLGQSVFTSICDQIEVLTGVNGENLLISTVSVGTAMCLCVFFSVRTRERNKN